jgi:hypothetical protein
MVPEQVPQMSRNRILVVLGIVGVLAGFALVRSWNSGEAPPPAAAGTSVPVAVEPGAAPSYSDLQPADTRGSSMSVVGTMSREEMIRRGIAVPQAPPSPAAKAAGTGDPSGGQRREGAPAAVMFPPEVGQAASSFMCLCGCGHTLDQCPCNDQPIGAVTMLSYLQKLMATDSDPASLSAGMEDRYGELVLAPPREP